MKKILSAILALAMILCMGIISSAAADPTPTPTAPAEMANAQDAANWTLGNGWAATNDEAGKITLTNTNANGMAVYNGETVDALSWRIGFDITRTDVANKAVNTVKFSVGTVSFFIRIKIEDASTYASIEWMNDGEAAWTKAAEATTTKKLEGALDLSIVRPYVGNAIIFRLIDEKNNEVILNTSVYDTVETIGAGSFALPMSGLTIGGEEGVGAWTLTNIAINQYSEFKSGLPSAGEYEIDSFGSITHTETSVFSHNMRVGEVFDMTGEFTLSYSITFATESSSYLFGSKFYGRNDKDANEFTRLYFNPENWTWTVENQFYFAGWYDTIAGRDIQGEEGNSSVTVTMTKINKNPAIEGDTDHFYYTLSQGNTVLYSTELYHKDMGIFYFSAKSTNGFIDLFYEEHASDISYTISDIFFVTEPHLMLVPVEPEPTPIPTPDITLPGQEGNTTTKAPVTQAPATTQAPAGADDEEGGANIGLIIGIVAAVVVVVAVVVVIVIKKKK